MPVPARAPAAPPAARSPNHTHFLCDLWLLVAPTSAMGLEPLCVRMMVGTRAGLDCAWPGMASVPGCGSATVATLAGRARSGAAWGDAAARRGSGVACFAGGVLAGSSTVLSGLLAAAVVSLME